MTTTTATNASIAPTSILTGGVPLPVLAVTGQDTDTPTNTIKLLDGGTEGARLSKLYATIRNTTVAGRVYLFRGSDSAGTTKRLIASRAFTAYAQSTTVDPVTANIPDFSAFTDISPLFLGPGESLWVGVSVAQTGQPIVMHGEGGRYNTP